MSFEEIMLDFQNKKISENEFSLQIQKYFEYLLSNNYFQQEKYLKLYPFLSELQDEDIYQERMLEDTLENIQRVLSGEKDYCCDLWITVQSQNIESFCAFWGEYKSGNYDVFEKIEEFRDGQTNSENISNCYVKKLMCLFEDLPRNKDIELLCNMLYTENVDNEYYEREIEETIQILLGKRPRI